MRALALALPVVLFASTLPAFSQAPATRYIKIDVTEGSTKTAHKHGHDHGDVHVRVPLNLAKGILESLGEQEFQISKGSEANNAKPQKIKVDQLMKLLENVHTGDMLLEVKTGDGTQVKITVE
jgi:hypothetical protein